MILKMYSIYDSKTEVYTSPLCYKTRGESVRSMIDLLREHKHEFAIHPEDYTMFELGTYDVTTGTFDVYAAPICVSKLIELVSE